MAGEIDYDKLAEAQVRAYKRAGVQPPGSGAAPDGNAFKKTLTELGDASQDTAKNLANAGTLGLETWRQLSKGGTNFSNSIDQMGVAALQSRVNLRDFADIIQNNGKNLAGLGGSVTRGAEAFAKLSKGFFDSNMTDELRQLGYTSKDLNEVLAIQASTQRTTMGNDAESRRKSYDSAAALAREMDMIAKLTGKSREEQMEAAKKRASDGQVEAKLRLIGLEQGAEAEAAARAAFQKQFAEAEARGMGQMAKELFATGTVTSDEAATQYALLGEAAQKTGEQMKYLSEGNIKAAEASSKEADAANAKNQRDPTLLRIATLGDAAGTAGNLMKRNVEDNMALHDSIMAVSKTMKPGLTDSTASFGKALDTVRADILKSSTGNDPSGRQVSGVTRGAVAMGTAAENIAAGAATAVNTRNEKGESVAGAAQKVGLGIERRLAEEGNLGTRIGNAAQAGQTGGTRPEATSPGAQREASGGVVGSLTEGLSKLGNIGAEYITAKVLKVENLPAYAEGGYIPNPEIALIGEKGPEWVLNAEQMKDTINNAGMAGVKNVLGQLPPPDLETKDDKFKTIYDSMKSMAPSRTSTSSGINVAEISKTISTSISSMAGGAETTTKRVQSDESKDSEKELKSVKDQYAAERTALAAKFKEMMPDASVGDRRRAMNASEESQSLNAKYDALMKPLEKKIEDGIKWEVSSKESAVEETKKVIEEETKLTLSANKSQFDALKSKTEQEEDYWQSSTDTAKAELTSEKAATEAARAETFKLAELTRSIVGKNVKGMSEDAIQAMLPAGTAMEDFYEDMDGNLQSWSNDSAKKLQEVVANEKAAAAAEEEFNNIGKNLKEKVKADMGKLLNTSDVSTKENEFKKIGTEQGAAAEAEARSASAKEVPKTSSIGVDLNAINLPGFGQQLKAATASIPEKKASPGKKINPETGEEYTPVEELEKQQGKTNNKPTETSPGKKDASLSDVVASLNMLNKQMGQLLYQTEDLGRKQINATQANSSNVYAKQ